MTTYEHMLGAPFKLGGRSLTTGIDCLGVLIEHFRGKGRHIPDPFPDYSGDAVRVHVSAAAAFGDLWVPADGTQLDDVAVWQQNSGILHVGIHVAEGRLLHALVGAGVACTPLRNFKHLIQAWYRLRGAAA